MWREIRFLTFYYYYYLWGVEIGDSVEEGEWKQFYIWFYQNVALNIAHKHTEEFENKYVKMLYKANY